MKTIKSIDMNSSQLKNVAAPSADTDAVNKAWVNTAISLAGVNGSGSNLTVTDAGDYYVFDVVPVDGGVTMIDNGDYYTLVM